MNKTRLLKNYGHSCTLPARHPDGLFIFDYSTGLSLFSRICGRFRKYLLICDLNMQITKYCRSEYALYLERKNHLEIAPNIIHPLSSFRKWWEIFMILISTCILLYIPFATTFTLLPFLSTIHEWQDYPRIIFDIISVIDIIFNFRTGFYDDQREINLNRKDIAKQYLKGYFFLDLLSSIPPLYLTTNITVYTFKFHGLFYINLIICGLKFFRLFSYLRYLNNFAKMKNVRNYYAKIFLIIVIIAVLFHWITCLCIVVSVLSVNLYFDTKPHLKSWITHNEVWNSSVEMMYATALFRTSCIVSNAEYELMNDHTVSDQVLVCVLWVTSRILFTTFVSLLIQITRSLTSSQTKYKEMVLQLMQYMHHKQLSSYTQNRLISYYEFRFQKSFFREQEILNTISGQLRQEILMLKCLKLVENVPFFKGLPQSLLMRIVLSLQLEIFLINDVIIKAKAKGSSMYFIGTGTVATYTETGKEIYHLHDGQHFGEIELVMTESTRIASVIAIEPCELYRLDRKDFIQIIRPYPELLTTIEQIAAERLQYITAIDEKYKHFYNEKRNNRLHMI